MPSLVALDVQRGELFSSNPSAWRPVWRGDFSRKTSIKLADCGTNSGAVDCWAGAAGVISVIQGFGGESRKCHELSPTPRHQP
jgi:hypothetical protein